MLRNNLAIHVDNLRGEMPAHLPHASGIRVRAEQSRVSPDRAIELVG